MESRISNIELTIFDTETTGLEPEAGDRIVEIAAIRLRGAQQMGSFEALVNPKRPISEGAFQVNKITAKMLENAPPIERVLPEFLEFIRGSWLCSYNAGFDLEFLDNEIKLSQSMSLKDIVVIDVLKMARRLLPGLERYALWFVAQSLGIKLAQEHRALSDVKLTLEVFMKLRGILDRKGIVDFENFLSLFALSQQYLDEFSNYKLARIQEAMDLGVKLKIKYLASSNAEVTEREVIPKEIRKERNRTLLVGFCCLRNEERSFRIDGILHLEIV